MEGSTNMVEIRKGNSIARVEEKGAYLSSLVLDGVDVIKKSMDGEQTHGGSAVLIPYAGRVREAAYIFDGKMYSLPKNNGENSIHGFLKDIEWHITASSENDVSIECDFDNSGYPSSLHTSIKYSIGKKLLMVDATVKNTGGKSSPLLVGFHPYFLTDGKYNFRHSEGLRELNFLDQYFPDGSSEKVDFNNDPEFSAREFDNAFVGGGVLELVCTSYTLEIARNNMGYLVIYNGKYAEKNSVAVEPMTGAPDAYNNGLGLIRLSPGEVYKCGFSVSIRSAMRN